VEKTLPKRKRLPHEIPSWVEDGAVYYITVCALPRHQNHLAKDDVSALIRTTMSFYQEKGRWWVHPVAVMPDHVHALMSFACSPGMGRSISDWKRYVAGRSAVDWQRGFFDHRLRKDESFDEKAAYIRMNPVRAGLVGRPEEWPYIWTSSYR